jgi:hypothetical protein
MNNYYKQLLTFAIVPFILVSFQSIDSTSNLQAREIKESSLDRENIFIANNSSNLISNGSLTNGIFTPNSSELFFREGREKLDVEIQILLDKDLAISQDLLEIREDIFKQQQELENKFQLNIMPDRDISEGEINFDSIYFNKI